MKTIYILLTGQIKMPHLFDRIIKEYLSLINNYNLKIILSTWSTEIPKLNNAIYKNRIISRIYKPLKDNGDGNIIAQAYLYRKGIEYIKNIEEDNVKDLYILKSRPDVIIKSHLLKQVFEMKLKLENDKILNYKIWTGWAHAIKPFYLEDAYFYSHYDTMIKLMYFDNNMFKRENLGQGISHIRRFIMPFLIHYPILNEYINNKNNYTVNLHRSFITLKDKYIYNLLETYYNILNKYFVIYLDTGNSVYFRLWNTKRLEINYNDSLETISRKHFDAYLKLIHDNSKINFK
jgi:hypothetical protein